MSEVKKIIIFGVGGNCLEILDIIEALNKSKRKKAYLCVGFLDDKQENWGKIFRGIKVLGPLSIANKYKNISFISGIHSISSYWKIATIINQTKLGLNNFISLIHPSVSISETAHIGMGSVIFQNVVIGSNTSIGNHVMILPNTVVSHNSTIEDYTSIAAGVCISGRVHVGKSCYLGTNCSIIEDVKIGDYALVGMGSVVLTNVEKKDVIVGNPGRVLRKISIKSRLQQSIKT